MERTNGEKLNELFITEKPYIIGFEQGIYIALSRVKQFGVNTTIESFEKEINNTIERAKIIGVKIDKL